MISPSTHVLLYPQVSANANWPKEFLNASRTLERTCEVKNVIDGARYYLLEPHHDRQVMTPLWRAGQEGFVNVVVFHERPYEPDREPWHNLSYLGRDEAGRFHEAGRIVTDEVFNPVFVTDVDAELEREAARFARFHQEVVQVLNEMRTSRGAFPEEAFED